MACHPTALSAAQSLASSAVVPVSNHGSFDPPPRRPAPSHQPAPLALSAVDAAADAKAIGGQQLRSESGRAADNEFFKLAEKEHRLAKMMEREAQGQKDGDEDADVLAGVLDVAEGLLQQQPAQAQQQQQQQQQQPRAQSHQQETHGQQQSEQTQSVSRSEVQTQPPQPQRGDAKRKRRVASEASPINVSTGENAPASRGAPVPSPSDSRFRMKARLAQRANGAAAEPSSPSISDLAWAAVVQSGTSNSSHPIPTGPAVQAPLPARLPVERRVPSSLQSGVRPFSLPPAETSVTAADMALSHLNTPTTPTTPGTPSSLSGPGTGDRRDYVKARLEHRQWRLSLGQTAVPDDEMLTVDQRRMRTTLKQRFAKRAHAKGLIVSPIGAGSSFATPRTDGSVGSFGGTPRFDPAPVGTLAGSSEMTNGKDSTLHSPRPQPGAARSASLADLISRLASSKDLRIPSSELADGATIGATESSVEHSASLIDLLRLLEGCHETDAAAQKKDPSFQRRTSSLASIRETISKASTSTDDANGSAENRHNGRVVHPLITQCKPASNDSAAATEACKPAVVDAAAQERLRQLSRFSFLLGVAQGKGLVIGEELSSVLVQLMDGETSAATQPLLLLLERMCSDDGQSSGIGSSEEPVEKADGNQAKGVLIPPDKQAEMHASS